MLSFIYYLKQFLESNSTRWHYSIEKPNVLGYTFSQSDSTSIGVNHENDIILNDYKF